MKKFFFILLIILITGCGNTLKEEKNNKEEKKEEPVLEEKYGETDLTINLFFWSQCSHCHEEIEWLKQFDEKYSNIYVNYYEVTEYTELDQKVREYFDIEKDSVPLTIIGNDYYLGYGSSSKAKFMQSIEKYTTFKSCNIVDALSNSDDVDECFDFNYNN